MAKSRTPGSGSKGQGSAPLSGRPDRKAPDQAGPTAVSQGPSKDVVRGTLDLLILKTLSLEPMHGWAIAQRLEGLSDEALRVGQGSLYPALQRLEEKGWIDSRWKLNDHNRKVKFYELTKAGKNALGQEAENWRQYVDMVEAILRTT